MDNEHIIAPPGLTNTERNDWYETEENTKRYFYGTRGGWIKDPDNPIFGSPYGVCFDVSLLDEDNIYKMWFSWRTKKGIGYTESKDGKHWDTPSFVFGPVPNSNWEGDEINRPSVIRHEGIYMMWYSGQMIPYEIEGTSSIGLAISDDGINWTRRAEPVLMPIGGWEQHALMCPHVMFDERINKFRMWYSGGSNHEPDAIGYAESTDGINWHRISDNPVFDNKGSSLWDRLKVLGCQILFHDEWYYMFYIGHFHEERASVGLARSKNGIDHWERFPQNPIIAPDAGTWDAMSVYKPFVLPTSKGWTMWYNGARFDPELWAVEEIGLAYHAATNLWTE